MSLLPLVFAPLSLAASLNTSVFYPFKGMVYIAVHPVLWGNLFMLAIPQLLVTIVVVIGSFAFLYPPQAAFAFVLNGPAGLFGAFIGMFQQSMSITRGVSEMFVFPRPLRILFDAVLVQEGMDQLIVQGRMAQPQKKDESDYQRVMSWLKSLPQKALFPFWAFMVLFRFFVSFIPVLGVVILILLDIPGTAQRCLGRYFELKGWDQPRINGFMKQHRVEFFAFGLVAATLEALPFIGFAFAFTNTAGGALWAIHLEKSQRAMELEKSRRAIYSEQFQRAIQQERSQRVVTAKPLRVREHMKQIASK